MNHFRAADFLATPETKLANLATRLEVSAREEEKEQTLHEIRHKLSKIQEKMYAHNRYSVLICLQGMDTSGKDSLVREVFKEMNPRGIVVHSFKSPNAAELEHDYLWRHYLALPEKGKVSIFNRTHYENVLVTRVHPEYLLKENLPQIKSVANIDADFWKRRYQQINNFESHIAENGTIVIKFFFYLSKEEQRQRLLRRLEEQKHNWKFSVGDLQERELWDKYMEYYEEAIAATTTETAPWYIVPADDKEVARVVTGSILLELLQKYDDISEPELDDEVKKNLRQYREQLENEA
ncbi:MAG TPA: PPK2 family polyphosphate kinase [Flavobacterium sp.]|jgi:PPK2 family polyphosphate:nucleotide phosphotransferase